MRSLYLKIFLWFGVAMLLVNAGSFITGIFTERRFRPERQNPVAPMFAVYAETAAAVLETEGRAGLSNYMERVEQSAGIHAVMFDERGAELTGRPYPPGALELARRTSDADPFAFDFLPGQRHPFAARAVTSRGGARYTLVGELPEHGPPGHHPPPHPGEPASLLFGLRMFWPHILAVLVVGGLFCYWLARYIATPVVKLRAAAHELADGNLSARVSPDLLRRGDEIGYLGRDFNLMAGRIESLVEAQRRLLRDISHELRSPLTRLGVALELVRRRAGPEVGPGLDRIEREAQSINEMIGRVLMLSRLETGAGRSQNVPVDLRALVRDVADDADFEAGSRGRSVELRTCEACAMTGDAALLRSAVENVVRNAVRHTREGTAVEISLTCEGAGRSRLAVVSVRDHGPGVPEASLNEIFRPFYRVEDARDRLTGGVGLGLAIAERATRLHGGTIKAANAPGGGLLVEMRLPARD